MKTPQDPRHLRRIKLVKKLFAWEFYPEDEKNIKNESQTFQEILQSLGTIDKEIEKTAPEWSLKQINRIDLAILRLAVFELIIKKDLPFKVVVDEAVEIAKEFGADSSPNFINGALGNLITRHGLDKKE